MTAVEPSRSSRDRLPTASRRRGWIIGLSLAGLGALTLGLSVVGAAASGRRTDKAGARLWLRQAQRRVGGWLPRKRGGRSLEDLARRVY